MSTTRSFVLAAMIIFLLAPTVVRSQYAEDVLRFSQLGFGVGGRTLALGGTSVGRADDYTSLFGNPAGLAALRDYEVSVGFVRNGISNDVTFLGTKTRSDNNAFTIENAGVVYPVPATRGSLTFAMGFGRMSSFTSVATYAGFNGRSSIVEALAPFSNLWSTMTVSEENDYLDSNIPYQLGLADIDTSNGDFFPLVTDSVQQSGTVLEGGGTHHWSFGAGIDIARDISMGVSLNFVSGSYTYDREFTEFDSRNVYANFPLDFRRFTYTSTIESDLNGFNMLIGIMIRKQGRYKLGMAVRTPTTFEIEETFSDAGSSSFDNGDEFDIAFDNRTSYKIVTPYVVSSGVSVQLFDWLSVSGDAEYTDWTQMTFETENPDLLAENRYIKRAFRGTTNLRGGVEVTLWELGLVLRGGGAYLPSPYKGDPTSFDQAYVTGGIGVNLDNSTMLNFAGAVGRWKSFRDNYYIDGLSQPSSTTESLMNSRITATLSFKF